MIEWTNVSGLSCLDFTVYVLVKLCSISFIYKLGKSRNCWYV